jgi:peptidyl-prolyl cis-trans isomerase C
MKSNLFSLAAVLCCCSAVAVAQQPQASPAPASQIPMPQSPALAPDTVVLTFQGKGYTAKQVTEMLGGLPPQAMQGLQQNPQAAMNQLFLIRLLSDEARTTKLDQQSPHKEALDALTRQYLANVALQEHNNKVVVTPAEQEAYYEKTKDKYETASLSVIYVSFSNNPVPSADPKTKKPLTEAEAKAKADKLYAEIKGGADFAKLASANSDDKDSAAKGGVYATIRRADSFPAAIKDAVFKLEAGGVSDPVRQPNGFYLLKRTEKNVQPYVEVRDQIFQQLKNEKFQAWFQELQKQSAVKIEKPEFFTRKP